MTAAVPVIVIALTLAVGWWKNVDMSSCFADGVKKAMGVLMAIFPNILIMLTDDKTVYN